MENTPDQITSALAKSTRPTSKPVKRYALNFASDGEAKRRNDTAVSPEVLRRFSITHEVSRICINARKRQISQLDWDIVPLEGGKGNSLKYGPKIEVVKRFFKHLGGYRTRFRQLQDMMIEDLLVLDTIALYKERDAAGRLLWLKEIDAATIKVVTDEWGNTPEPPDIAYRQYIRGERTAEFTAEELIWDLMNPRSTTPYGLAPLESLILVVSSALRAELFNLDYLTYQNVPEGLLEMPEGWSRQMIDEWQDAWDAFVSGSGEATSKLRVVPSGTKYSSTKKPDEMGFEVFNHWLMQITCAMFDIQPHEIGFTDKTNRATAKTQDDVTQRRGIMPLAQMLKEIWDDVIQIDLGFPELEFTFLGLEDEDTLLDAQADAAQLSAGAVTIDEVRIRRGLDPIGIDVPYISAPGNLTWVTSGVPTNSLDDSNNHYEVAPDKGDDEKENDGENDDAPDGDEADDTPMGVNLDQNQNNTLANADTMNDLQKSLIDDAAVKLDTELKAFKSFATTRLKKGKNYRDFASDVLHPALVAELNVKVSRAKTVPEINKAVHWAYHVAKADQSKRNKTLEALAALSGYTLLRDSFNKGFRSQMGHAATKVRTLQTAPKDPSQFVDKHVPAISDYVATKTVSDWNQQVFNVAINDLYNSLGSNVEFKLTSNAYKAKLDDAANNLLTKSSLDDTSKKVVADIIRQGAEAGKTPGQIATDISDTVDEISAYRADMIAVTETNGMANDAQLDALKQMGVETKSWVTAGDNPCPICEDNEAASPIGINEQFPSGDDSPEAHPWCMCTIDTQHDVSDDSLESAWDGS